MTKLIEGGHRGFQAYKGVKETIITLLALFVKVPTI